MIEQVDVAVLERLEHERSVVYIGARLLDDGLIRFVLDCVLFRVDFLLIAPIWRWWFGVKMASSLVDFDDGIGWLIGSGLDFKGRKNQGKSTLI